MSAANLVENKPVPCGFGQQKLIFVKPWRSVFIIAQIVVVGLT